MFTQPYPSITEPHGTIHLCARVLIGNQYAETHVIEADADTQTAIVRVPGRQTITVSFWQIVNIALKYSNGEVIQNFGAPRINRPESLAFIRGYQDACK